MDELAFEYLRDEFGRLDHAAVILVQTSSESNEDLLEQLEEGWVSLIRHIEKEDREDLVNCDALINDLSLLLVKSFDDTNESREGKTLINYCRALHDVIILTKREHFNFVKGQQVSLLRGGVLR